MQTRLYSAQILELACQLERDGAEFYRKAAAAASDPKTSRIMLELADIEDDHLETFTKLKAELPDRAARAGRFDAGPIIRYLHAVTNGQVIDLSVDPSERFTGRETPEDLLRTAIEIEKESVVLYAGLQSTALGQPSREVSETILREELGHIATLAERLEELAAGKD